MTELQLKHEINQHWLYMDYDKKEHLVDQLKNFSIPCYDNSGFWKYDLIRHHSKEVFDHLYKTNSYAFYSLLDVLIDFVGRKNVYYFLGIPYFIKEEDSLKFEKEKENTTMKTWEMFRELSKNPNNRYMRLSDGLLVTVNEMKCFQWANGHSYFGINDQWVRSYSFQEACECGTGKKIKSQYWHENDEYLPLSNVFLYFSRMMNNGHWLDVQKEIAGEWFVKESES